MIVAMGSYFAKIAAPGDRLAKIVWRRSSLRGIAFGEDRLAKIDAPMQGRFGEDRLAKTVALGSLGEDRLAKIVALRSYLAKLDASMQG